MNFLKKLFSTKTNTSSNLETLMNKDLKSTDGEKEKIYLQVIEDFQQGKSDVYLVGKHEMNEVVFFQNTIIVENARHATAFTDTAALSRWNKTEKAVTKISTGQFLDLCVHFNICHVVINLKSANRYFFEFKIKNQAKKNDRYGELCQIGTDAYFSELEDINWFEQDFINKAEVQNRLASYEGSNELIFALTQVEFDSEGFEDIAAYKTHLNSLLAYIPSAKLKVINEGNYYVLDLKIGRKSSIFKLKITGDGYQQAVLDEFINPALAESGSDYRFYTLPVSDQIIRLIYASSAVYYTAQDKGLIPDEDYFM